MTGRISTTKKNIAVFFGGKSAEHDVSIITAHIPIIESLLAAGNFEVWPVYIAKDGSWYCDQKMNDLQYFKQDDLVEILKKQKKVQILFDNGLKIIWPGFIPKTVNIDVAFPAMHGTYGEDGSLMGLLRMAGVPFVGCDLFASAVAMDKVLTKQVLQAEGVPVVPYVWFSRNDWVESGGAGSPSGDGAPGKPSVSKETLREKIKKLKMPLFVKPVHLGSSIGITKVKKIEELENAIEVALHYDSKVLVEEGVENLIEVTLPVMGNSDLLELAGIERPLNTEFFDFNDKYIASGGKKGKGSGVNNAYSEIPAKIDKDLSTQVMDLGKKTYKTLGCEGIARIDFLIDGVSKKVYVNEVNTLPGSLYAHNWKKMGVSGVDLVTKLLTFAEERFNAQKNTVLTFDSEILKQIGGIKLR